eukprot:TRINITY_DN80790_c0_g1_i1.p1 TRINITY_DN80790_c0_g1~~TRINITY_DN80790_c0_g1_i1.p1  ORF type:complete len:268 (-),score=30.18 TRINITY_DN80790_c0_g1_i1:313-1116(-)
MRGIQSFSAVGRQLTDDDLNDKLEDAHAKRETHYGLLDFSSNRLQGLGAEHVTRFALECTGLLIVKLHKNALGDAGASALAPLVEGSVLRELHLSHNGIGPDGCEDLLRGASRGLPERRDLLMIRLEHNRITSPADVVLRALQQRDFCCRYDAKCTRAACARGRLLHLPLIWKQEGGTCKRSKEELEGRSPTPTGQMMRTLVRSPRRPCRRSRSGRRRDSSRGRGGRRSRSRRDRSYRRSAPRRSSRDSPRRNSKRSRTRSPSRRRK